MKDHQTQPKNLTQEFKKKATLTPDEKLAAMVKAMPEPDRLAYQDLVRQQQEERTRMNERLAKDRPELLEEKYREALTRVTGRKELDHDMPGTVRPLSRYQEKARRMAAEDVAMLEAQKTDRAETRQFEIRYNFAKTTTERRARTNAARGACREGFNTGGKSGGLER